ncbi:MAG: guanylate kinase [Bacteroidota bacterium]|nr:guanylate kinase [Bacteroidota bacterium]
MNKMIIISAPSGAGKTTIVKEIMKIESLNLMFSISATSRKPRKNEKDKVDYNFLSISDFKNKIKKQEFVEWEQVYENQFYGTLKSEIKQIWDINKNIIFDVDVKGGIKIKKQFPDNSLAIFIKPPSIDELKNRLQQRGTESIKSLQKRIDKAKYELTFEDKFDVTIINNRLSDAILKTKQIITEFLKH